MPDPKPRPPEPGTDFERRTDFIYLASGIFLMFQLGEHRLGVPKRQLDTYNVISFSELPEMPHVPSNTVVIEGVQLGVTVRVHDRNLRVRDLRSVFSKGPIENRKENCILLRDSSRMNRAPLVEGIIVDNVCGVQSFNKDQIESFDGQGTPFPAHCLLGRVSFEGQPWLLLHLDRLLESDSSFPPGKAA